MTSANSAQLKKFHKDGFLILENFFSTEDLKPVETWISSLVDDLASSLCQRGLIQDLYENASFETRLIKIEQEYPDASILIHQQGGFGHELLNLWTSEKLNNFVKTFFTTQPALHPVWNIRAKTPENDLATVPWHQDAAYLSGESDNVFQLSAWIPLVDVSRHHGPLCFVSGYSPDAPIHIHELENKSGNPKSWYLKIPPHTLPKGNLKRCIVPKGSLILFHQKIPHCCEENFSDQVRWSLDLRWQSGELPNGLDAVKPCLPCTKIPMDINEPNVSHWAKGARLTESRTATTDIDGPWMERWR